MDKTPVGKLKTKSLIAIVIMFFVLISMGMATYSWYIVSTAPQVKAVETYMAVIDPMLAIARATDDHTPPDEVGNDVSALDEEKRDITWGTKITTYGDNTLQVDYPATLTYETGDPDGAITAPSMDEGGRLNKLEESTPSEMGQETDSNNNKMNGVRYYRTSDGRAYAVGLGVWVTINQEEQDLVVAFSNVKFKKDVKSDETIDMKCAGAAVRVISEGTSGEGYNEGRLFPCDINEGKKMHYRTIYSAADGNPFPANEPVLLELIFYIEGDTIENDGIIAADIANGLCLNIDTITFYNSVGFEKMLSEQVEAE